MKLALREAGIKTAGEIEWGVFHRQTDGGVVHVGA